MSGRGNSQDRHGRDAVTEFLTESLTRPAVAPKNAQRRPGGGSCDVHDLNYLGHLLPQSVPDHVVRRVVWDLWHRVMERAVAAEPRPASALPDGRLRPAVPSSARG